MKERLHNDAVNVKCKNMIKKLSIIFSAVVLIHGGSTGQNIAKSAPQGFDSLRPGVSRGKIDTILYESKTVGTNRRALIYTPPGFSKKNKYPVLYSLR